MNSIMEYMKKHWKRSTFDRVLNFSVHDDGDCCLCQSLDENVVEKCNRLAGPIVAAKPGGEINWKWNEGGGGGRTTMTNILPSPNKEKEEGHIGRTSNTTLRILSVKGWGVPPKSVTPFLPKILSVKGGGDPPYGQNPQSSIWTPP